MLRFENRVRITVQLIRARKEEHLWAQSYERELGDLLKLQGELATTIASNPHPALRGGSVSVQFCGAHRSGGLRSLLRGRFFCNKRTEETLRKAREYFEQAIAIEPGYASAYSGLADTYFYSGYYFGKMDPAEAMPKARAAALKALELDSGSEAHTSLGLVKFFFDWDLDGAGQEFRTALALNPNYAIAYQAHSVLLGATNRHEQSIAEARRGLEVDPLSVPVNNIVGEMLSAARQWTPAIDQYRKTVELDPGVALVHENIATALEEIGCYDDAIEEYLAARKLSGEDNDTVAELREAYEKHGVRGFRESNSNSHWNGGPDGMLTHFKLPALRTTGNSSAAMAWLERL